MGISQLGVSVVEGGGVLQDNDNDNDDTYMTPLGRSDLQSPSAYKHPSGTGLKNGHVIPSWLWVELFDLPRILPHPVEAGFKVRQGIQCFLPEHLTSSWGDISPEGVTS